MSAAAVTWMNELERYRALVRAKDPATMEKRRRAALCPVCGKRFIDGAHR